MPYIKKNYPIILMKGMNNNELANCIAPKDITIIDSNVADMTVEEFYNNINDKNNGVLVPQDNIIKNDYGIGFAHGVNLYTYSEVSKPTYKVTPTGATDNSSVAYTFDKLPKSIDLEFKFYQGSITTSNVNYAVCLQIAVKINEVLYLWYWYTTGVVTQGYPAYLEIIPTEYSKSYTKAFVNFSTGVKTVQHLGLECSSVPEELKNSPCIVYINSPENYKHPVYFTKLKINV